MVVLVFLLVLALVAVTDHGFEIKKLRAAIRKHRDQRLDDRCWMDDYELYESLPEGATPHYVDLRLLPREEMLKNCERYVECRATTETPEEALSLYRERSK